VTRAGEHFGFPFCHQGDSPDPEFGARRACSEFTAPVAKLGAHVAALGMRFYRGAQFPAAYRGNVFIAEHGSWNRSSKVGYQVVRVPVDAQGRAGTPEPFLTGFLQGESAWGRPADVLPLPDGSLLVSDDSSGAIYRVRYGGP
jgi:glucose/arabinose dehydrogenase